MNWALFAFLVIILVPSLAWSFTEEDTSLGDRVFIHMMAFLLLGLLLVVPMGHYFAALLQGLAEQGHNIKHLLAPEGTEAQFHSRALPFFFGYGALIYWISSFAGRHMARLMRE